MGKRSVLILLFIATIDRIILQGIYPILPVVVAGYGVSTMATAVFMVVTYIAVAAGSMLTPRLLKVYPSVNKLSLFLSVLTAGSLVAMGRQHGYTGMLIATSAYWFLCGVQINIYSVLMSYISPPGKIGTNFGLLANTTLIGAVLGSFAIGPLIHWLGNAQAFTAMAVAVVLTRFLMLAANFDVVYSRHKYIGDFKIKKQLWALLLVLNAGIMLSFIGRFNISLLMKAQGRGLDAISLVFAWGALIAFPLPWLFGRLSQRLPGKGLLILTLLCASAGMGLLYMGNTYTTFLLSGFLICIMTYCSRGVSQKLIYDMYHLREQTQAQSMLTSANWIAAILGFVLSSATSGILSLEQVSLAGFGIGIASTIAAWWWL